MTVDAGQPCTLDASLLISHLDGRDAHHREATAFLLERAGERHLISQLNLAEVLVGYARADRLGEGQRVIASLGIEEVALPDGAAHRLAQLRAETGLKMPDCCVLMTAEETGSALASFDTRLRQVAARRGVTVCP